MNYPVFIFHELIIRLDQINPVIGRYLPHIAKDETFIVFTGKGSVFIPEHFLEMQFKDPRLINDTDLAILAHNFKKAG